MAASSSSISRYCEPSTSSSVPLHDIFLSHSGAQKPFVTALYERLRTQYTTFFDITDHSLPLGEDFTRHIFHAIDTCRMALIVLSEEYVQSKWPMIELRAFFEIEAPRRPKIVPLFFKVEPSDLRHKQNKEKWRTIWDGLAKEDSRIKVPNWEFALRELAKCNGIQKKRCEEDHAYIERVFSQICEILPSSIRHDFSDFPGIHRMSQAILAEFKKLDKDECKVCVLGMYGLPGSGKSTLCRYLCDDQFTEFGGRVFYLDLPTSADAEQVLVKFKELLQLMNFHNKVDLSRVSHLRQVGNLLERTNLSASKVFLIVDKISSQESHDLVRDLLRLRLAVGSKVLIVAHSHALLSPLLQKDGTHLSSHYVYRCMRVPYLYKKEALQILLQSGGRRGLADAYAREDSLTERHWQITANIEEVVDICSAEGHHLPLVLKIMGYSLSEHHELDDVENWNEKMKEKFRIYKADAVKQLLAEKFKELSENLQTLFLDLALFIVPLRQLGHSFFGMGGDYWCLLSALHGLKQEKLEVEMNKLQKHGFLTIWGVRYRHRDLHVHDFYLEFAASIKEACNYFWSGLTRSNAQWNEAMGAARTIELRTVVLELDESHEDYEFGQEHASVKAMILRNCKSLKVLRGMNLTSLVSLQIYNCPNLKKGQPPAAGWNLQMFEWSNQKEQGRNAIWKLFPRMELGRRSLMGMDELLIQMKKLEVLSLVNTGMRKPVQLSGCLPQLRVLQVLEPHMKRLRACDLPNLELLVFFGDRYVDDLYEAFNSDLISNRYHIGNSKEFLTSEYLSVAMPSRHELRTVTFARCPKLQVVHMRGASLGNELQVIPTASSSPHVKELLLNGIWSGSRLPVYSALVESLELLQFTDVRGCTDLNFRCTYKNLRQLWLIRCPSVVQVTGLDGLPALESLVICNCRSLKILSGLGGLAGLRRFKVSSCPNIHFQCLMHELECLTELENIAFRNSNGVMNEAFNVRELANLRKLFLNGVKYATTSVLIGLECATRLHELELGGGGEWGEREMSSFLVDLATFLGGLSQLSFLSIRSLSLANLSNLTSLKGLEYLGLLEKLSLSGLENVNSLNGVGRLGSLKQLTLGSLEKCTSLNGIECLGSLETLWLGSLDNLTSLNGVEHLSSLKSLQVQWLDNLTSLKGVECLGSLEILSLGFLQNLTCLEGIESLIKLKQLTVNFCPSVEEMPSLSALLHLFYLNCSRCMKLRSLKGWEALPDLRCLVCFGCDCLESGSFAAILHARDPHAMFVS